MNYLTVFYPNKSKFDLKVSIKSEIVVVNIIINLTFATLFQKKKTFRFFNIFQLNECCFRMGFDYNRENPGKSYIVPEPLSGPRHVCLELPSFHSSPPSSLSDRSWKLIMKPSELSPCISNVIKELFNKYLDKECYKCIEGQSRDLKGYSAGALGSDHFHW